MRKNRFISGLLASLMMANIVMANWVPVAYAAEDPTESAPTETVENAQPQVPTEEAQKGTNLAVGCEATASDFEIERTSAAKAVDGDKATHWGTHEHHANGEWIKISLKKPTEISKIVVFWERDEKNSNPQNIKKWHMEVLTENDKWVEVKKDTDDNIEPSVSTVELSKPVLATEVKITVDETDGKSWPNVGINEIEVYGQEKDVEATANHNHMQNKDVTVTASSTEADLTPEKVKDGKLGNKDRWACEAYVYQNQWLKVKFPKVTKVKEIDFTLFTRNVAPMPSNIKSFQLEYVDESNTTKTVNIQNRQVAGTKAYETNLKHIFENVVYMSEFTLKNFDASVEIEGNNGYNNISITEIQVYSNEQIVKPDKVTLDSVTAAVVQNLNNATIAADTTEWTLPTVSDGYTISFNGADFEQIIGSANNEGKMPVIHPLNDKTVKVSFNVTETSTGNKKNTGDIAVVVQGTKTTAEGSNAKPKVIPEIQEWYADSADKLAVSKLNTVTYSDEKLKAVVDEFVRDYANFTGINLKTVQGPEQANAFNFTLGAPDALLGAEGYTMDIQKDRINVASEGVTGNMYGMQTILQMYKENNSQYSIGQMRDYPRFQVRGFLLDAARKPVSLEMMKQITRTMRYYKMNDFQAHLSDNYIWLEHYGTKDKEDEGFKAYEAFRLESSLKNANGDSPTAKDYFITKKAFKDFIHSERALGMNIVPEIDVPAHATSFTKIWPELKISNRVSSSGHSLIDHFDLTNPKAYTKITEIFNDYIQDGTFDAATTVHIGADEFLYDARSYREFLNKFIPQIKKTNPVRMWGGLTMIRDNPVTNIVPEARNGVEINLWSKQWADGIEMYNLGYKLINTIDDYGYMVPDGNKGRGVYVDLLNIGKIFSEFEPNRVGVNHAPWYQYVPSGDDQMLGAAFAIWNDNIDKKASGLTESDLYWRFFDAMPFYAEKTWAATGKEKGTAQALSSLAQQKGTGPNTNPYYLANKTGKDYESYDFESGLKDTSGNNRDLQNGQNADIRNNALQLNGKVSYVTTPINRLGNGNQLSFDIKLDKPAVPGEILFESDAPYGTHDIRIMEDGKLGFTRELYNYYFDYELPVGKTVTITIATEQQKTSLYVNGELTATAKGKFIHNGMTKREDISHATFALPLERIGSKTNAVSAVIDNVVVTEKQPEQDIYNKNQWHGEANTETPNVDGKEGQFAMAFDNKLSTHWHSDWKNHHDTVTSDKGEAGTLKDGAIGTVTFDKGYEINQVSFQPRQDKDSGLVTKASLYIQTEKGGQWIEVAKDQTFAANRSKKTFHFDTQTVYGFKFIATQSNDGWVTVSEFDVANRQPTDCTVYVQAEAGGKVTGGQDVKLGKSVTVTATPNKGYNFDGWYRPNGEKVSTDAKYTFKVNGNTSLIAKFVRNGDPVEKNVTEVKPLPDVKVVKGTAFDKLGLPETVEVVYGDNETAQVSVTWNQGSYDAQMCDTYNLEGILTLPDDIANPDNLKASIRVIVAETTPDGGTEGTEAPSETEGHAPTEGTHGTTGGGNSQQPQTGDESRVGAWLLAMAAAGTAAVALARKKED